MALVNPYCSVAQVREEIRNTDADLTNTIEDAINAASRFIDDFKGRDYLIHDHATTALVVRKFDGLILKSFLYLPYWPVLTLTALAVNDEEWTIEEDYIRQETRLVSLRGPWPLVCASDKVSLTGTFGYVQATAAAVPTGLPSNIQRAAILIASAFTGHNRKEVVGLDGNKAEVVDKAIPKTAYDLLGSRKIVI